MKKDKHSQIIFLPSFSIESQYHISMKSIQNLQRGNIRIDWHTEAPKYCINFTYFMQRTQICIYISDRQWKTNAWQDKCKWILLRMIKAMYRMYRNYFRPTSKLVKDFGWRGGLKTVNKPICVLSFNILLLEC